jgi:hypothetical protein
MIEDCAKMRREVCKGVVAALHCVVSAVAFVINVIRGVDLP